MGAIYSMQCDRCNTSFIHQAGIGFVCNCHDCGEFGDESAPFFCPVCNKRFDPETEEFEKSVKEVAHWD